jgi:competence protein ComEC
MRDRSVFAMAAGAWTGALLAWEISRAAALVVVALAFLWRRPALLVLGVTLLACSLGAASQRGLAPADAHSVAGEVVLVGDPVVTRDLAVRVDVRVGADRYEATARGPAARALRPRAAGDIVRLRGDVRPRPPDTPWLEVRHVVGRLEVEDVQGWRPGAPALRLANAARVLLAAGGDALDASQRPLYAGLVYGDDRGQEPVLVDDLRAAGLGHLLAVSGQNVAVLLGAARPLIERCRYRVRLPLTLLLLGVLVLMTRAEPSVLRATAMAGVVAVVAALGRSSSALRVLALAVTALVLVDPVLVRALGFQLSVAASAGIIVLSGPIARRVPGPRVVAEIAGVTLAAQLAVAPIVLAAFGGIPVASLPANLLAAPVAGPVMVWGATGGVLAGVVGGPVATVLQLPARLALGWIRLVGSVAGRAPLGQLQAAHIASLVLAGGLAARRGSLSRRWRIMAGALAAVTLLQPAWALRSVHFEGEPVAAGVTLWVHHGGAVVEVDGRADPVRVLEALRRAGVRRVDLVVAVTGGRVVGDVVRALDARYDVVEVWAPVGHQIRGARVPVGGATVRAGGFTVAVVATAPRLVVHVESTG